VSLYRLHARAVDARLRVACARRRSTRYRRASAQLLRAATGVRATVRRPTEQRFGGDTVERVPNERFLFYPRGGDRGLPRRRSDTNIR
jgi:hypothetical protein